MFGREISNTFYLSDKSNSILFDGPLSNYEPKNDFLIQNNK